MAGETLTADRLAAYSDAVFAVIVTIMVLELKAPDIWHAREHLWDVTAKLFPADEKLRKSWANKLIKKLSRGRVETVVAELRRFPTHNPELRDTLRIEADYFERNRTHAVSQIP